MRVVGIDPGSRITGYGVVEVTGPKVSHVASGCLRVGDGELAQRLADIHAGIREVLETHRPAAPDDGFEMAVEQVFMHRNVASALKLGHARGVALLAAVQAGLPVHEYSATRIKQAVHGRGHAEKAQVQHMVCVLLGLETAPQADAADALAVALCHAHTRNAPGGDGAGRGPARRRGSGSTAWRRAGALLARDRS